MAGGPNRKPPNAGKGRPAGIPNKLTRTAREAFQHAMDKNGGADWLATWAAGNPDEFFKLYARMIPVQNEVTGKDGKDLIPQSPDAMRDELAKNLAELKRLGIIKAE